MENINFTFPAMGSTVNIQASVPNTVLPYLETDIKNLWAQYEQACSRFIPNNALAKVNSNLKEWVDAPKELIAVIKEAYKAYLSTKGAFDPRILKSLTNAGYTHSFSLGRPTPNLVNTPRTETILIREIWQPEFKDTSVYIGNIPIDLGGIAKGYTVTKTAEFLSHYTNNFIVNGGGDIYLSGFTPEKDKWRIGIENPFNKALDPIAVIRTTNMGVATSSISKRYWADENGNKLHHIINPQTGLPADSGVTSVTVVAPHTFDAEVMTKTLFLQKPDQIAQITHEKEIPALWVTETGQIFYSIHLLPFLEWLNGEYITR